MFDWPRVMVLDWFVNVLEERFGHRFALERTEDCLKLSCFGSEGSVIFDALEPSFFIPSSNIPYSEWDAVADGWHAVMNSPLPAPGVTSLPAPLIEAQRGNHFIHYDILGLTYWMLCRMEEIGRADLDRHGRFPATSSHAFRHGYLERPVVDEWLGILSQVIQRQWSGLKLKRHNFDIKVSHDVDTPSRYGFTSYSKLARSMAGDLLKRHDIRSFALAPRIRRRTTERLHPADPANSFDWLMDLSDSHGLRSAFYFICGRTDPRMDAFYDPEHPAIRDLMRRIHARGHEVGLHPSYNTYRDSSAIVSEAERLRRVCSDEGIEQEEWGGRMHYLRWEHPTTMLGWEEAGLTYDSTLSYADRAGFRCGTCFEYHAFDPVGNRILNLRIRPLVAMDRTIISKAYMGLGSGATAFNKFKQLKDICRTVHGSFTLLWHNSSLSTVIERELYRAVLAD